MYDNSKLYSALNIIQLSVCKYTSISIICFMTMVRKSKPGIIITVKHNDILWQLPSLQLIVVTSSDIGTQQEHLIQLMLIKYFRDKIT